MASTDGSPWFYPDRVSAAPGEEVTIHASGPGGTCRLVATHIGARDTPCAEFRDIEVGAHPIPEDADSLGCGWPAAFTFTENMASICPPKAFTARSTPTGSRTTMPNM